ncbi:MAG: CsgG/HfaB family protein [Treponema sp.]|jgi:TolB-like protein|nr:CsgG/HfaB family protein [Treponema sp.]
MKKKVMVFTFVWISVFLGFAQEVVTLDNALIDIGQYFTGRLPARSKVVVLNISSNSGRLSEYVIEEFTATLVNTGRLTVVDRHNLDLIRDEMNFQMSGEVSDDSALSIGRQLGAQTIISGSIDDLGDILRLRIRAISVETAQILGIQTANVGVDRILAALTGRNTAATSFSPSNNPPPSSTSNTPSFSSGGKPQKKVPARSGNFEVTQGRQIPIPIDTNKFQISMIESLEQRKWTVDQEGTGYILCTLRGGNWWVQLKICYWDDEYWYEYVNSNNLSADPARNRIHRNYDNWISNLESSLRRNYYR